jgi:hypothetical protein
VGAGSSELSLINKETFEKSVLKTYIYIPFFYDILIKEKYERFI